MKKNIFVTGIGTDVGKTVVSAIIVEALKADYWKPIQAGDIDFGDMDRVKRFVSNTTSVFHQGAFGLTSPESPHSAAEKDGVCIDSNKVERPSTQNHLVVEGAGGILVPISETETIIDLIAPDDKVVVVSRHYLGSINHTMLTIEVLKARGINIAGIIFNGNEHPSTESIIEKMTGVKVLGRIGEHPEMTKDLVATYANQLRENLEQL